MLTSAKRERGPHIFRFSVPVFFSKKKSRKAKEREEAASALKFLSL